MAFEDKDDRYPLLLLIMCHNLPPIQNLHEYLLAMELPLGVRVGWRGEKQLNSMSGAEGRKCSQEVRCKRDELRSGVLQEKRIRS